MGFVGWSSAIGTFIGFPYKEHVDEKTNFLTSASIQVRNKLKLPTILFCPAYQIDDFLHGQHVSGWNMQGHNGENKINPDKLRENDQLKRYHYLKNCNDLLVPELVIDFKHFFTIPTGLVYSQKNKYLVSINELFRENLSQRFAGYLSRIGLPEID